jgi:hypothetical protein
MICPPTAISDKVQGFDKYLNLLFYALPIDFF